MTAALISSNSFLSYSDAEKPWPEPPGEAAFFGLAGEVVDTIDPYTEADRVAVLVNFLIAFGNACGSGPHMMVGATRHSAREFAALVGDTSKARKGDSWTPVAATFSAADPEWSDHRVSGGLSTGEGLIHSVRDAIEKQEPIKEKGRITGYQNVIVDEGVEDKRLLVIEPELAKVTRVIERQGNSLSPVLRAAWDNGTLHVMTRGNPIRATGAHISVLAHITIEELTRELSDVSAANGFANRYLWFAVRRSKLLPEPSPFTGQVLQQLASSVAGALYQARRIDGMQRDERARALWRDVYGDLAAPGEGLAGSLLARAEAHVLRASMLYALSSGSRTITIDHLTAALELWSYAERSVLHIFGDSTGDPVADAILKALRATEYLSRTEISSTLFGRNESAARISQALQRLLERRLVQVGTELTEGRPREIWKAVS